VLTVSGRPFRGAVRLERRDAGRWVAVKPPRSKHHGTRCPPSIGAAEQAARRTWARLGGLVAPRRVRIDGVQVWTRRPAYGPRLSSTDLPRTCAAADRVDERAGGTGSRWPVTFLRTRRVPPGRARGRRWACVVRDAPARVGACGCEPWSLVPAMTTSQPSRPLRRNLLALVTARPFPYTGRACGACGFARRSRLPAAMSMPSTTEPGRSLRPGR